MIARKFDLTYSAEKIWGKDLFIFVNHKVAPLCWAILKEKNELCDVLTFDSHRDYCDGVILQREVTMESFLPVEKRCFSSKYNRLFPHFTISKEFVDWNPLSKEQNNELIVKERKYFLPLNDNFIDVAFMKGIIANVYCYYVKTRNRTNSGKCDDIFGKDHLFAMDDIKNFRELPFNRKFILDIDLDFFTTVDYEADQIDPEIVPAPDLKVYLNLIKTLSKRKNCVGLTLALEPGCCGSEENCLKLCEHLSKSFDKDIVSVSRYRLNVNQNR